jgi:hexokinase
VGGIVGTGTNFCYCESIKNIYTLNPAKKKNCGREAMIINLESGNFDKLPQNRYDEVLDKNSINRGHHIEEKMVSGLYLGELTRYVILDVVEKGFMFDGNLSEKEINVISKKGSFTTASLSKIIADNTPSLRYIGEQLSQWGIDKKRIRYKDKEILKQLCVEVSLRAARITASIVFAIVTYKDEKLERRHTIAIDGTVFQKHPHFKEDLLDAIKELTLMVFGGDKSSQISFVLTSDGSGIGAAIIAATAAKK